jgi:hypothetical protein
MMRALAPSSAACLALVFSAAPASADEPEAGLAATNGPTAAEPEVAATPPRAITRTTIDPNVKEPVCKRHIPTGSRIAERRCEMPADSLSTKEQASREILRRDVEDMRRQQQLRDQARNQAMADALRRRSTQ